MSGSRGHQAWMLWGRNLQGSLCMHWHANALCWRLLAPGNSHDCSCSKRADLCACSLDRQQDRPQISCIQCDLIMACWHLTSHMLRGILGSIVERYQPWCVSPYIILCILVITLSFTPGNLPHP